MARESKAVKLARQRVTEQYIVTQINYHYDNESFRDHKDRMQDGDRLYQGRLNELFPNESAVPDIPYVENKFKNALHDISRLASEGKGAVKFVPRGGKDRDLKAANIQEAIAEGYWRFNKMSNLERKFYLDLAGSGFMAVSGYYDDRSPYPQLNRLDPRFGYPDVRNGKLQNYLHVEVIKERVLARQFPHLDLNDDPTNDKEAYFACYYDDMEVVEAVALTNEAGTADRALKTRSWQHDMGCVPVAFEMLDTYDGSFHGLFEQLAGPLMVRNKIIRFLVDYIEQTAHAPIVAKNVLNPDDEPGPTTIYQLDPNADSASMDRLPPAQSAGTVWQLLGYMGDQEEKEAIQPPSRAGQVSQSIASGSFVDRTQGQLTSVVKELQDKLASMREQVNEFCMKIDEKFLPDEKPLYRPVAGEKMYTPSEDIKGWYFHEVKFGAGAGLDRLNADARIQNHLTSRLISREEARAEIDYLDDSASSQDKIDRENLQDVVFQKLITDPRVPPHVVGQVWLAMKQEGDSLEEALEKFMPDMIKAAQEAQQGAAPTAAPTGVAPGAAPAGEPPVTGPTDAQIQLAGLQLQAPPIQQNIVRSGR